MAGNDGRRDFGNVRRLPSGKFQAQWRIDGKTYTARVTWAEDEPKVDRGPLTFSTRRKAERYLERIASEIEAGSWRPPVKASKTAEPTTLRAYADEWLERRDIKPTTHSHYRQILDRTVYPELGDLKLGDVDRDAVEAWYAGLDRKHKTWNAHSYALLRSILSSAHERKLIADMPPRIKGAGSAKREREMHVLEVAEVDALATKIGEPYGVMVKLSAWCALRFGEATSLTAYDVDTTKGVVKVRRGVTRTKGEWHVSTPKNGKTRTVRIAPRILDDVKAHVRDLAPDDLLFPAPRGGYMIAPTFGKKFRAAAKIIGRPDVRVHDLRHFGGVRFAMSGATLAELMEFGGWLTVTAAERYFHVAKDRMDELTTRMSEMADDETNGKED